MSNKPNYILKVQSDETYTPEGATKPINRSIKVGAAWVTEGGAIFCKSDYPVSVNLNNVALVPFKEEENK